MSIRLLSTAGRAVLLAFLLLALALMPAVCVPTRAMADSCANAAERFGASANLPDCRAYELVTPPVKEDSSNLFDVYGFPDGEHVVFSGVTPFPGAASGIPIPVLSSRTPSGWVTRPLAPPQGPGESDTLVTTDQAASLFVAGLTSDFSTAFVNSTFADDPLDQNSGHDVYRVNVASGAASLESLPDTGATTESFYHPPGGFASEAPGSFLSGSSADGSRVFFTTVANLPTAPGTPAESQQVGDELYERHDDHTYLVGVLPDGSVPSCGAELGEGGLNGNDYYQKYLYGSISADGSNVVFHTPAEHLPGETPGCNGGGEAYPYEEGALYLREDNGTPQARTMKLPGVVYLGRTADGSKIISGGAAVEGGAPLYEYDIATEQTIPIGTGNLMAYSADGSVVYYMSGFAGYGQNGGQQKLMVYADGVSKTLAGAGPGYAGRLFRSGINFPGVLNRNLPVTVPDGSKLLFLDRANLTSYNSAGPGCAALNASRGGSEISEAQHCDEAYVYDLATNSYTCVSCNPDGTPPTGETKLFIPPGFNTQLPQTTASLSEDGSRAFFETENALVPQDTNGQTDVYEWEDGQIYLLSSGQGAQGSRLDGVSRNGDDVIFQTSDVLLPQVVESSTQIYDARVGGGFPYTAPVYGCDSGQCQGPQTPAPLFAPPASATFVGIGNPATQAGETSAPGKAAKPKRKAKRKVRKLKAKGRRRNSNSKGRQGDGRNGNGKGKK